jgi:hypothetical protein
MRTSLALFAFATLCLLLFFACDAPRGATRSPDGEGYCCAPDYPTTSCASFGGFVVNGDRCATANHLCDVAPVDWISGTDSHGCARYTAGHTTCGFCPPDLGLRDLGPTVGDAATSDAAMEPDGSTTDASTADASVDADAMSDGG